MSSDPHSLPFRVHVEPSPVDADLPEVAESEETEAGWSLDDIEAAYQQALESLDSLEATVSEALGDPIPEAEEIAELESADQLPPMIPAAEPESFFPSSPVEAPPPSVTPRQVVEALLFVGGVALPARKIADVVSGSTSLDDVQQWVDELNSLYGTQGRPYRIEHGDSGFQMRLRSEFEKVRLRVYGIGPREVKLSQEVLEVLSFIAYSQPVTEPELEALGRAGVWGVVRQLLRRELIQIQRSEQNELQYVTAPRFLELFGLRSMHDLPLPGDFAFK